MGEPAQTIEPPQKRQPQIKDQDRDALYVLPLPTLPLRTPGLLRARMLKDSRLDSAIELFHDQKSGSGRVYVDQLEQVFGEMTEELEHDQEILHRVAELTSLSLIHI